MDASTPTADKIDGTEARGSRDAGLFGPGSEAWRLDREAMVVLGAGPRALLLQIAHPDVAAGVAEHSDFRSDPWRRLDATLRSYLRIVYGSLDAARGEIRRLNVMHRGITGDGYSARDPALAMWVHATLIDSTIVANRAWLGPLTRDRVARFYEETRPIGVALGVPESMLPRDLDGFQAYVEGMLAPTGPIRVGPTARDLANVILHPPLPGRLGRLPIPTGIYDWTMWPSLSLLPPQVRDAYGFRWGVRERTVTRWLVAGWRAWNPLVPAAIRQMPQALAADRRIADQGNGLDHAGSDRPGPAGRSAAPRRSSRRSSRDRALTEIAPDRDRA